MSAGRPLDRGVTRTGLVATICACAALTPGVVQAGGGLDPKFSKDGKAITGLGGDDDSGVGVALTRGGKTLVAAESRLGGMTDRFVVLRYTRKGRLDRHFSRDGVAVAKFPGHAQPAAMEVQTDGRVVVAGTVTLAGTGPDFAVARFLPNGRLDRRFSGDGKQVLSFAPVVGDDFASAVAIRANGKIVLAGQSRGAVTSFDLAVARLKPNGKPDRKFSGDGRTTVPVSGLVDRADDVAIQKDGRIVTTGTIDLGGPDFKFLTARFRPSGTLDSSFTGDGTAITEFPEGAQDQALGIGIQRDRRIVAAGFTGSTFGGPTQVALARYLPNGEPDLTFAGDGTRAIEVVPDAGNRAADLALVRDKIVTAGFVASPGSTGNDFLVLQIKRNGSLDPSFSGDGIRTTHFLGINDSGQAVDARKRSVVAAGHAEGTTNQKVAVARYRR